MKKTTTSLFILFLFVITLISCHKKKPIQKKEFSIQNVKIPNQQILKSELVLNPNLGVWFFNNIPFSGYAIAYDKNNTLKEKTGFYKGKKQGVSKKWHTNKILRIIGYYSQNKLINNYKTYRPNGIIESECYYINGQKNGIEKYWHPNGQLAKKRTLTNGKENGLQQAWLNNGKIYVNYEAKNGRVFGLKRANLCYKLNNENVVLTKK